MPTIAELQTKAQDLLKQAQAFRDKSQKQELNAEEKQSLDRILAEWNQTRDEVAAEKKHAANLARVAELASEPVEHVRREPGAEVAKTAEYRWKSKRSGERSVPVTGTRLATLGDGYEAKFRGMLKGDEFERRDLQVGIGSQGGYWVPTALLGTIMQELDDQNFVRSIANIQTISGAESLGVPTLENDPSDAEWTAELNQTPTADTTMSGGRRDLQPKMLAKKLIVSRRLIQRLPSAESYVLSRLAYKHAVSEEKAFLTGNGSQQPLGIFTASTLGISTTQDVNTGANTNWTADALKAGIYGLKAAYRGRSSMIAHRDAVSRLAQLKDSEGRYFLQYDLTNPDILRVMGIPVYESEYAPSGATQNNYAAVVGDFSYYMICDALGMAVNRVDNDTSTNDANTVAFYLRKETDGMPIFGNAFRRFKWSA